MSGELIKLYNLLQSLAINLEAHLELILRRALVALLKYLNCSYDKTTDTGDIVNINYYMVIIILTNNFVY